MQDFWHVTCLQGDVRFCVFRLGPLVALYWLHHNGLRGVARCLCAKKPEPAAMFQKGILVAPTSCVTQAAVLATFKPISRLELLILNSLYCSRQNYEISIQLRTVTLPGLKANYTIPCMIVGVSAILSSIGRSCEISWMAGNFWSLWVEAVLDNALFPVYMVLPY